VTERPILFRVAMVAAILANRTTVTRRVGPTWARVEPGTRLWVREAHAIVHNRCWTGLPCTSAEVLRDPSDEDGPTWTVWAYYRSGFDRSPPRWRPSIYMPRWACRLTLEVVSVTEQRAMAGGGLGQTAVLLPDLDDAEARREGFADRPAFIAAWLTMHPDHAGPVWRVEFRRTL